MFKIKTLPILRRTLDSLFYEAYVFRMNPLENKFHGRLHRSIELEDSKGFLGPDDLACGRVPTEAPRVTELLSFR